MMNRYTVNDVEAIGCEIHILKTYRVSSVLENVSLAFLLGISFVHLLLNYLHNALSVIQYLREKDQDQVQINEKHFSWYCSLMAKNAGPWIERSECGSNDWLKKIASLSPPIRSILKPKLNVIRSQALRRLHVFSSDFDWFSGLSVSFVYYTALCYGQNARHKVVWPISKQTIFLSNKDMFAITLIMDFLESPSCSTTSCDL